MTGFNARAGAVLWVFAGLVACAAVSQAEESAKTCAKEDFEAVVEAAADGLRDLNSNNRPAFQEKLRELRDKRKWSHDEFLEKAKPFVQDDKTAVFDKTSDELLSAIGSMGQQGATSATPDCGVLLELRARMKLLVDTQTSKWSYMFDKLNAELAR